MSKLRRIATSWILPAGLLIVAAALQAGLWFAFDGDQTMQVMSAWFIVPSVTLLLLVWWTSLSPVRWRIRLAGLAALAAGVGLFFTYFRFDGFDGAFRPMFSRRSQPTAEEVAVEFFRTRQTPQFDDDLRPRFETPSPDPGESLSHGETPAIRSRVLHIGQHDWPQFRGPNRDGIVRGQRIRTDWDARPPQALWRQPIGPGWSSFAVVDGLALTQEQRGEEQVVVAYDIMAGAEAWRHSEPGRFSTLLGGVGPLATPTVVDSRAYVLAPAGALLCLDAATGDVHWRTNILEDAGVANAEWGMSGSPLVYDDLVVVNPGGDAEHDSGVAAYNRHTGERVWAAGNHPASYTAPQLETINGVRQVVVFDGDGAGGHDASTGRELWRFDWTNSPKINVVRPIVRDDGTILISSSYGAGAALFRLVPDGDRFRTEPTGWEKSTQLKLKFNDPIVRDGLIYGLDEGILACFDPETGRRLWKRGRYGYGQLLLVDEQNLLLVLAEDGRVALVPANPERFEELASFQAIEGKTWNHPVLAGGLLLVRNSEEIACYDLRP